MWAAWSQATGHVQWSEVTWSGAERHRLRHCRRPHRASARHNKSQQFVIVDHTANIRNGSEVSKIWRHGFERRRVDDGTFDRYWRCGHCQHKKILKCTEGGGGTTSYAIRYLLNRHFIDLNTDDQALPV